MIGPPDLRIRFRRPEEIKGTVAADSSTLIIAHFPAHKGKGLMGPKWADFKQSIRDLLQERGLLDENSSDDLLIYLYSHPYIALANLFAALEQARAKAAWKDPLPVQLVLHLAHKEKEMLTLGDPGADLWDGLDLETVYVTRALKLQWDRLMENKELPEHSFAAEEKGFLALKMADRAVVRVETLFPYRDLALRGKYQECFYCGRKSHKPAACPSKKLTMDTQGLPEAGYQPFAELAANYKEACADQKTLFEALTTGVAPERLREDRKLQALLAYYDVFLPYQIRFLWYLAFNPGVSWQEIKKEKKTEIDSRSFNMGLDCLRVGQYGKAEEFFEEGRMRREGKLFYAKIAQAFRALELGRESDAGTLLESALAMASHEKERVYANLLLIRQVTLQGDLWKANQVSSHAASLFGDVPEILYARLQVMVREDFRGKVHKQLQELIQNHRRFFLTALLDPVLLPIQGVAENLLSAQFDAQIQTAGEKLAEAEAACEELTTWLPAGDPTLQANQEALDRIREQHRKGTYFAFFDVIRGSQVLATTCQRLWNEKADRLLDELDRVTTARYNYYIFWKSYPAKPLFTRFVHSLAVAQRKLEEARTLLAKPSGNDYHAAVAAHRMAQEIVAGLDPIFTRMVWVKEILTGARIFGRKLLISEGVLAALTLPLLFVLPRMLSGGQGGLIGHLLADPALPRQAAVIALALVAPIVALVMTTLDLRKS
ncbi:MAG: hypothetical protein M0017_10845 [Desulfobacteraceae bacterium]|nr:hypothetical protein [Desulfobacteraceae bacterium]